MDGWMSYGLAFMLASTLLAQSINPENLDTLTIFHLRDTRSEVSWLPATDRSFTACPGRLPSTCTGTGERAFF